MLNTIEKVIGDATYTMYDTLNGYKFQEVQRATIQLQKDKIDEVAYTNMLIKIFVVKVSVPDPDTGESKTLNNVPDILEYILNQDVNILDQVTDFIQDKMDALQGDSAKKKS